MRRAISLLIPFLAIIGGCQPGFQYAKVARPDKFYASAVSLSPSTTEIISSVGSQTKLIGRTEADNFPTTVKSLPVVASLKPDYEKIKQMSPGLILYDASLYNNEDIAKIKQLGIQTFQVDANTVDDFCKQLFQIGDLIMSQTTIADEVGRIQDAENAAKGDAPAVRPKVAVIMPEKGSSPMIVGTKSFIADVIKIAGGDIVGPSVDRFVTANPEELVQLNPDIIIVPTSNANAAADVQAILNDPKMSSINAVKNKKIEPLDADVVLRRGNRVDKFITAAHLAIMSSIGKGKA